ncbi:MAG: helix-turn-helix domain-containing protein [Clostridia bacterium]|nr:helix-turn-helix domain-containing protein [Clostridia bacterium]
MEYTIHSSNIAPFVRYSAFRNSTAENGRGLRRARDCRLFCFTEGCCTVTAGDTTSQAAAGDVVLVPPMYDYNVIVHEGASYYVVNFDYTMYDHNLEHPIPILTSGAAEPHQRVHFTDLPQLDHVVSVSVTGLENLLSEMTEYYETKPVYFRAQMNARMTMVLVRVFEQLAFCGREVSVAEIISYIGAHCAQPLTNREIGERFHYHPNYISKLLVRHTGKSLHSYLLYCRVEKAITMLKSGNGTIAEIAAATGWKTANHFARSFRQITGYTPSSFRSGTPGSASDME